MAIKNTNLGGTDWATNDYLLSTDLNDTFDAAYDKLKEKTTFWRLSEWYTVYDSFASVVSSSLWSTSGSVVHSATNLAGGDASGEAKVSVGRNSTSYIVSNALPNNKNAYHFKGYFVTIPGSTSGNLHYIMYFRQRNGTLTQMFDSSTFNANPTLSFYFSILVVKTASDTYDVYMGGKNLVTISDSDLEFGIAISDNQTSANDGSATVYIDDVRYTNE